MLKKVALFFVICAPLFAFAGSLRLLNDSPYTLRVVIRGNDGTFLGEMVLNAQHANTWTDTYGQVGYYGKGTVYREQSTKAQTPYTVLWYCSDGSDYSFCNIISTGSTVTAQTCAGTRQCKPQKKKEGGASPNQPEGQYLHKGQTPE